VYELGCRGCASWRGCRCRLGPLALFRVRFVLHEYATAAQVIGGFGSDGRAALASTAIVFLGPDVSVDFAWLRSVWVRSDRDAIESVGLRSSDGRDIICGSPTSSVSGGWELLARVEPGGVGGVSLEAGEERDALKKGADALDHVGPKGYY
jgi:hypothetical protein